MRWSILDRDKYVTLHAFEKLHEAYVLALKRKTEIGFRCCALERKVNDLEATNTSLRKSLIATQGALLEKSTLLNRLRKSSTLSMVVLVITIILVLGATV